MSYNKIALIGNLGRDPELRYTPQGVAVCTFTLATNEKRKDKSGEPQDITTWFKVTLWRAQAENAAKYLSKGKQVYIEGRISIEEWQDREGALRTTLVVQATEMQFLSGGQEGASTSTASSRPAEMPQERVETEFTGKVPEAMQSATPNPTAPPANADDDIPF